MPLTVVYFIVDFMPGLIYNFSDEQTAHIADVELDYVKKVRAELEDQ